VLDREDLLLAVAGQMEDVMRLAKITTDDDAANMGGVLDRTFRALGVDQATLVAGVVADGAEEQALAYAEFFLLRRAVLATVAKMNVAAGSAKANLREQYENLKEQMNLALAIAQGYGLSLVVEVSSSVWPVPYVGGESITDYEAIASESDRISPMFAITDLAPIHYYDTDY
jgi:hypothetical protein